MRTGVVIRPWDGPNVVDDAVAGATELVVEPDGLDPADRERTWRLLGRLES